MTNISQVVETQSPQSRWRITQNPEALPAECLLCRGDASTREWFVDTYQSLDWHGAVYICSACITDFALIVGFLTPEQAKEIKDEALQLVRENYQLLAEVAELHSVEEAVDAYIEHRNRRVISIGYSSLPPVDTSGSQPDGEVDGGSEAGPSLGEENLGVGEGTTSEPSDGEGMDDIRSDDGPDGDFRLDL